MPPCVYPFSQMEVKLCDLTWLHKSLKFNLHHLWKRSVGFKMAMLTPKLGILLLGYFKKNPNKGLKIYFSELPLQFPHALSSIPLQIPWFFWNSLFSNLVTLMVFHYLLTHKKSSFTSDCFTQGFISRCFKNYSTE